MTSCSIGATVATPLLKSQNVEEHVAHALSCRATLDVLEAGLTAGELDTRQATAEFMRCVEEASFLDGRQAGTHAQIQTARDPGLKA